MKKMLKPPCEPNDIASHIVTEKLAMIEIVSKESDRTQKSYDCTLSIKCQQQLGNSEQCSSDDVTGI